MTRILGLLVLSAFSLLGQRAETVFFRAVMLPANEVPAININASGTATIRAHVVRDASGVIVSGTVDFIVNYSFPGAVEITGLHIHNGPAGVNAPVTISSGIGGAAGNVADPTGRGTIVRSGQVQTSDANGLATLRGMMDNPAGYYANLHTTVNAGGVIRGQLQKPDVVTYLAVMATRNEVPPITTQNADGLSAITVMRTYDERGVMDSGQVIFEADYALESQKTLTGYHIHNGPAGVNAAVVVNTGLANQLSTASGRGSLLFPVEVDVSRQANLDVMNGLFENPEGFYANIHTTEFPAGLIRGQLRRTDQMSFPINMSPANEEPPVLINASAPSHVTVNTIRNPDGEIMAGRVTFDVNYRFPGPTVFQGLHIHNQVARQNGPVIIDSGLSANNTIETATGFGNIYRSVLVTSAAGLATLNSMVAGPERHYLNLHTQVNPAGVVREQTGVAFSAPPVVGDATSAVLDAGQRNVAPGGRMSVFGLRFAYAGTDLSAWEGRTVPMSLNGVEVTVGGRPAPVLKVADGQVDVQVPLDLPEGAQPVVVKNVVGASSSFPANVRRNAPAIWKLRYDADLGQVIRAQDITFITPDNPARAGDILVIIATGLGQTTPPLATGRVVPDEPLFVTAPVAANIGGRAVPSVLSVAAPGVPGAYAVAVVLPPGIPAGLQRLQLMMGDQASNTVMLPVR
ncbi:MAG: CHRD domain-containing protein [Acidobacteria bacterium]|nr:CHRD domain-containing protein [Acidobacteriota bacterium]